MFLIFVVISETVTRHQANLVRTLTPNSAQQLALLLQRLRTVDDEGSQ